MLAFAIAVTGVILLDRPVTKATQHSQKNQIIGTLIAICAATCWAIANLGFKTSIPELGIYSFCFLQEATVLLISGSAMLINRSYYPPTNKDHLLIFFIAALTIVGVIFNNLGMNQLPLNLFSLLVLAQPLTTFLVAYGWLKERPTKVQWVGSALLLTGVYLGIA
ncbi:MAG: EamA-like transporter family [Bacteroidota bacterium]|jgi:drug/metabolite transporter (DMT)-like permease